MEFWDIWVGSCGAFAAWLFVRTVLPFHLPDRLALPAVVGVAYGVLSIPSHRIQAALAAATVVFFLVQCTAKLRVEVPEPWKLKLPSLPRRHKEPEPQATGQGFRPGGRRGRRIPAL